VKIFLKILASILLLVNGIGAIYGGGNLIVHPDGGSIQLSLGWLTHSIFDNYLIPGIILFVANGLFSIIVLIKLILKGKRYSLLVMVQGLLLSGWIVVQIMIIQTIYFLHYAMGGVGVALIGIGWLLHKREMIDFINRKSPK
jgi:hypothetical protein